MKLRKIFLPLIVIICIVFSISNVYAESINYELEDFNASIFVDSGYDVFIKNKDNSEVCNKLGIDESKIESYMDARSAYFMTTTPDFQKNIIFTRSQDSYTQEYYNLSDLDSDIVNALADGYSQSFGGDYNIEKVNDITYMIFKYDLTSVQNKQLYFLKYKTFYNGYDYTVYIQKYSEITNEDTEELISVINSLQIKKIDKSKSNTVNNSYSSDDLSFLGILLGIPITAICYMIIPFILVVLCKRKYDKYGARRMAMWNSIIVGIIFAILTLILYQGQAVWSAAPAFLYYFINSHVWIFREKKEKSEEKRKEKDDNKKHSEKNEIYEPVEVIKKIEEEPVKEEVKEEPKKKEVINKDVLVCSNCGNIINASDTKCKKCGEKLSEEKDEKIKIGILSKKQPKTSLDQKYSDLKKLKELLDDGIITKKEFDEEKSKIMGE